MKRIDTVIIGAGQCGLAMSRELSARAIDHVILERGAVANSWRRERWDSLRLLTPNWMNGLPGAAYAGSDPDGYMRCPELVRLFDRSAAAIAAPVMTETTVLDVRVAGDGYRVLTDQGTFDCRNVVMATGAATHASIPGFATGLPNRIVQKTPLDYRRPSDLPRARVLVVGASASGAQIARELHLSGRDVTLSVGEHVRVPRRYRDADLLTWMEMTGRWSDGYGSVPDLDRQRRVPSLQLTGASDSAIDLNALQDIGVEIVGRMTGVNDATALFSGSLANVCALADLKMDRLLSAFDAWAVAAGLDAFMDPPHRPAPTTVPNAPRLSIDLPRDGFGAVIWATGYRPDHSWLRLPVFDGKGRIRHDGGIVADGLYVMGLPFLRRRKSTFIDGAADDAADLATHICATRQHARRIHAA